MRIEQLECVAAVTRLGSMRRASEALHMSQPAADHRGPGRPPRRPALPHPPPARPGRPPPRPAQGPRSAAPEVTIEETVKPARAPRGMPWWAARIPTDLYQSHEKAVGRHDAP
ncbi:LysR family transcriptional regulator [Actinomadura soli]|uniref:LysR family transcriptional regulator n=1 Tax=Actinomadura soli TaxID=2508997 RepID=UPI00197A93EA